MFLCFRPTFAYLLTSKELPTKPPSRDTMLAIVESYGTLA